MKVFLTASLINAVGGSLMWPLVSMFVFDELGRSMADAGLVILIQSLGMIVGQFLGGSLYYRVGVKPLIVGSIGANAALLFLVPSISDYWIPFIVVMGLSGFFNALAMPAIQSFIGFRFASRRAEMFNIVYVANNIGVAIGTAASGFLADLSYSLSFIGYGTTSAMFAVFFAIYLNKVSSNVGEIPRSGAAALRTDARETAIWPLLKNVRIYLFLAIGTLLLNYGNSIWNTGVSPFIIGEGMPKKAYGLLWTLNGVLIFVAQPLVGMIRRYVARSISAQMIASAVFYLSGFACILMMQSYSGMVLGMILSTFGEMLLAPAIPAFLSDRGGKNAPFYIGAAGSIGSAGRVLGPYTMGALYDVGGLPPVAWVAVATAAASVIFYCVHASLAKPHSRINV